MLAQNQLESALTLMLKFDDSTHAGPNSKIFELVFTACPLGIWLLGVT